MSEYPSNWRIADLGDVINKITSGGTPKADNPLFYGGDIPFLKIDDITASSKYLTNHKNTITELGLQESSAKIVPPGTLLLTMYGTIGECCITTYPVATNQAIACFLDHPEIDLNYLYYCLRGKAKEFSSASSQTTQANISATILKQTSIAVPPLPEQKKIAEIISGVDNTIEKINSKKTKHQFLLQSMRQDIFNEESANKCRFEQVVWERTLGTTRRGVGDGESIPLVKMGDIARGDIKFGENERIQDGDDLNELLLQRGDILFNTRNTPALVGKTAIYDSGERCTYDNNLMRIRVAPNSDPWYLNHLMNSPQFLRLLTRITAGTTSVAAIYWNDLRRVEIPLPPIKRQKQIAKSIQSVLSVIYDLSEEICCLYELRNALSSDLLSGRQRVSV